MNPCWNFSIVPQKFIITENVQKNAFNPVSYEKAMEEKKGNTSKPIKDNEMKYFREYLYRDKENVENVGI